MDENIKEKIENKIIDWAIKGAGDRLVIFEPQASSGGADLVVEKKGEYETKEHKALGERHVIRVQIFNKSKKELKKISIFVNREADLKGDKNSYSMFIDFDAIKQDIKEDIRIVKLDDKKELLINKKDIGDFLIEKLK
jgi:hypothetical protein